MPTDKDVKRVAAEAELDPRTVARAFRRPPRSAAIRRAIIEACASLGIDCTIPAEAPKTERKPNHEA